MTKPIENALKPGLRLVLKLGKFQIISRTNESMKVKVWNNTVTITDPILARSDVTAGDILTFYTEVTLANPRQTPQ